MGEKTGEFETVKLDRKISIDRFLDILEERPDKIRIPKSVLNQSKGLRSVVEALRLSYSSTKMPDIEISSRGEESKVVSREDIDPFVRNLVGYVPNHKERFLLKLLNQEASSKESAVELSDLAPGEIEIAKELKEQGHVKETEDMKLYLSELGETVAEGARKMYKKSDGAPKPTAGSERTSVF